jgi:hypothetical protein
MLIATFNPYEAMWNYLRLFTVKANVKKLLTGEMPTKRKTYKIDNNLLDKKANQVAYSIRQADEYYKAAESVTINTSPLLYFYGMLALDSVVTICLPILQCIESG